MFWKRLRCSFAFARRGRGHIVLDLLSTSLSISLKLPTVFAPLPRRCRVCKLPLRLWRIPVLSFLMLV
jgi:hypothetical protein